MAVPEPCRLLYLKPDYSKNLAGFFMLMLSVIIADRIAFIKAMARFSPAGEFPCKAGRYVP
jgi:hypothetical protein